MNTPDYFCFVDAQEEKCLGFWKYDGQRAFQINGQRQEISGSQLEATNIQEFEAQLNLKFNCDPPYVLKKMFLAPGEYYPRMARPEILNFMPFLYRSFELREQISISQGQLVSFIRNFESISQYIHPKVDNLNCYGHEIRNLLILSCTELEAQLKGVMIANGYPNARTMKDYVKLNAALKLDQYKLKLKYFPWLGEFKPFEGWNCKNPTSSIQWYKAYHEVKHDRENKFQEASFKHALDALCSCAILFYAQYGLQITQERHEINNFFQFAIPKWYEYEKYFAGGDVRAKNYEF